MTELQIESLAQWSAPREVNTRMGRRLLRKAQPTDQFSAAWKSAKDVLKSAGVSWSKDERTGQWEVCWWLPVSQQQAAAENAAVEASKATDAEISIPCPDGLAFLPFQRAGIKFLSERPATLLADEMGLGKTVQVVGLVNLDPTIKKVLVVCPASLKVNWRNELKRWLARPMIVAVQEAGAGWVGGYADVTVMNYDILGKFPKIYKVEWDLLVADEAHYCFVGTTRVKTDRGSIPIGEIVDGKMRVSVLSCDLSQQSLEYRNVVGYTKMRAANRIVRLRHEYGSVTCTEDHRFWTDSGWVEAASLTCGTMLRVVWQNIPNADQGEKHSPVLQSQMRHESNQQPIGSATEIAPGVGQVDHQKMRLVQEGISVSFTGGESQSISKVLRPQLRGTMEDVTAGTGRTESQISSVCAGGTARQEEARFITANDSRQPGASAGSANVNESGDEGQNILVSRREWETDETTASIINSFEWADGGRDSNGAGESPVQAAAGWLQGGYGECGASHCEILGQTKDSRIELSRVVSVEVLESGDRNRSSRSDPEGEWVYCIEVEGNHNFFANGILVENCKSRNAQRTKLLLGAVKAADKDKFPGIKARRRVFMTGTPVLNKPVEIFPLLESLQPGKWTFKDKIRYCAGYQSRWGWDFSGAAHLDELQTRLRSSVMCRRLKKEVLTELPPKRRQIVEISANGDSELVREEARAFAAHEEKLMRLKARAEALRLGDDEAAYKAAVDALQGAYTVAFAEIAKMRHAVAVAKVPKVCEHIENVLEDTGKVVVFVHHHDVTDALAANLVEHNSLVVDGRTANDQRQEIVNQFNTQADKRVLLLGIRAAGVGLSVKASVEVFAELDWTPGVVAQAEDRCHGVGRGIEGEPLLVQHLVLEDSLDCRMAKALVAKQDIADRALDRGAQVAVGSEPVLTVTAGSVLDETEPSKNGEVKLSVSDELREHVHSGLRMLAGSDRDYAAQLNDAGFNKFDCAFGHALAEAGRLSDKMTAAGIRLCVKYRRQLGDAFIAKLNQLKGEK